MSAKTKGPDLYFGQPVTGRFSSTPLFEHPRPVVPDGDPCPVHPDQVSRHEYVGGVGLFSRCARCRDDFLAWYGAQTRGMQVYVAGSPHDATLLDQVARAAQLDLL